MADLTELLKAFFEILKVPEFTPRSEYKYEIENIDEMTLAKKDPIECTKFIYLLTLCCFFCSEREAFIDKLDMLSESLQDEFFLVSKMYISFDDCDRESYRQSLRQSLRNTITKRDTFKSHSNSNNNIMYTNNNESQSVLVSNDFIDNYIQRINYLENELRSEIDNKETIKKLQDKLDTANKKVFDLQGKVADYEFQLKFLNEKNASLTQKQDSLYKEISSLTEYKNKIDALTSQLTQKQNELTALKEDFRVKENTFRDVQQSLSDQIELLKENSIRQIEMNRKYDKLTKEYELLRDRVRYYDQLESNYKKLKEVIEKKENMPFTQSAKGEIEKLTKQVGEKERVINEQNKRIEKYEAQIKLMKRERDDHEKESASKYEQKERGSKGSSNYEIVIEELNRRLKELTEEIDKSKQEVNQQYVQNTNEMKQRIIVIIIVIKITIR